MAPKQRGSAAASRPAGSAHGADARIVQRAVELHQKHRQLLALAAEGHCTVDTSRGEFDPIIRNGSITLKAHHTMCVFSDVVMKGACYFLPVSVPELLAQK